MNDQGAFGVCEKCGEAIAPGEDGWAITEDGDGMYHMECPA
mgnify:CR=1 FL=1